MIYNRMLLFSAYMALSSFASAFQIEDLEAGFYRYSPEIPSQQRNLIWDLEDAFLEQSDDNFRSISAVVKAGNGSIWAVMSSELRLGVIDMTISSVLGSWPLKRWEYEFIEEEVEAVFYYGRQWPGTQEYFGDLTGCMANIPMRYGDINGDGSSEIVLFLPDEFTLDMLIFSPEKGKVIFSTPISTTNSIAIGEADQSLLHPDPARHYQYYLRSGQVIVGMGGAMTPAIRAYGKVYTGDFSGGGQNDLLLWRKLYRSLPVSNQTPGFEKLAEVWVHYSVVDGEYQKQGTPESVIRGWLAANDLTWQKGFPSKSECPGQEGELISEMHDPLLNDQDVLQ